MRLIFLALACFALVSCDSYAGHRPKDANFVGRYLPKNPTEDGMRADSELIISPGGQCTLTDFPLLDYSSQKLSYFYVHGKGRWSFTGSMGDWQLEIATDDGFKSQSFDLRIYSNLSVAGEIVPYKIGQQDGDEDCLIFVQHPLSGNGH